MAGTRDSKGWSPFLGLDGRPEGAGEPRAVIVPVPYEGTVSYGTGTAGGPAAVLEASCQVETYDEWLEAEPCRAGILTRPPVRVCRDPGRMSDRVRRAVAAELAAGRFVLTLGGEHSVSLGACQAHLDRHPAAGVIQFDAHADLRASYGGTPYSHACVMARIREQVPSSRVLQLGIRSLSAPEAAEARRSRYKLVWARDIRAGRLKLAEALRRLPDEVYLTFDVDWFDLSVVRSTGTPEPGGPDWESTMEILEAIFRHKRVIGADVVELCADAQDRASAFAVARLVHRLIGLALGFLPPRRRS